MTGLFSSCMRYLAMAALLLAAVLPHPAVRAQGDVSMDDAKAAVGEKRYCDAAALFLRLYQGTGESRHLYNAAEVALAAGDYAQALALYRMVAANHPDFEKMDTVNQRVGDATGQLSSGGGQACPAAVSKPKEPVCADGVLDEGEACDDGNQNNGDGCDDNCTVTACGNGVLTEGEQCDDGNVLDGDGCSAKCKKPPGKPMCGNEKLEKGEACDDGNNIDGDGCSAKCVQEKKKKKPAAAAGPKCGNGKVEKGETCDDKNVVDGDGCDSNCTMTACGNGVVTEGEICDDGNDVADDGCEATCTETPSVFWPVAGGVGAAGGVLTSIGGGVVSAVGFVPLGLFAYANLQLSQLEARYQADPDPDLLDEADVLQQRQQQAAVQWGTWGWPLVLAGAGIATVGLLGTVTGGAIWAFSGPDEEEAPPDEGPKEQGSEG